MNEAGDSHSNHNDFFVRLIVSEVNSASLLEVNTCEKKNTGFSIWNEVIISKHSGT